MRAGTLFNSFRIPSHELAPSDGSLSVPLVFGRRLGYAMVDAGGLDLLISTEARLASQLAAAQAEALAVRQSAQAAVEAEEAGYAAELAAGAAALATRIEQQCEAEIARIQAEADAVVRRFEGLSAQRNEQLAALVVRRVLAMWNPEAAP
jgi:hypothetical protein